jgi:hypothetical protein
MKRSKTPVRADPGERETHGHFTHLYAAVWKPYLAELMQSLRPMEAAAR